ncbi:MAG: hypothetical protein ACI841_004142 [Planctomycetota bacterium]
MHGLSAEVSVLDLMACRHPTGQLSGLTKSSVQEDRRGLDDVIAANLEQEEVG